MLSANSLRRTAFSGDAFRCTTRSRLSDLRTGSGLFSLCMKLTKEKIDLLVNGTREERVYACARSFVLFKAYYFTKYLTFKAAPFHEDFDQDVEDLIAGRVK